MPSEIFWKIEMLLFPLVMSYSLTARRQTGNGAKFWPDGSATKACVAGVRTAKICHFRRPFLWFISFARAKEMNIKVAKQYTNK